MGQVKREVELEGGVGTSPPAMTWDRRRSFRVSVPARASVWHKGQLRGRYEVVDLSIGGCSLEGGPPRKVGERLDVLLHLPHGSTLALHAIVRRVSGNSVGLSFEHAPPRAEDCLQDVVVDAFAKTHAGAHVALVIEPNHQVRQQILRTLRELGQRAIGVATALDAVQLLVEEGDRIDIAFIEAECATLRSFELIEFLANNYPRVRRVLVGEPSQIEASWLAETTGEVHGMLETPCERETMYRLLTRLERVPLDVTLS